KASTTRRRPRSGAAINIRQLFVPRSRAAYRSGSDGVGAWPRRAGASATLSCADPFKSCAMPNHFRSLRRSPQLWHEGYMTTPAKARFAAPARTDGALGVPALASGGAAVRRQRQRRGVIAERVADVEGQVRVVEGIDVQMLDPLADQ